MIHLIEMDSGEYISDDDNPIYIKYVDTCLFISDQPITKEIMDKLFDKWVKQTESRQVESIYDD